MAAFSLVVTSLWARVVLVVTYRPRVPENGFLARTRRRVRKSVLSVFRVTGFRLLQPKQWSRPRVGNVR